MCGGSLEVQKGQTICECEYCGTKQTVSATDDEITTNLYNRANNLRIKCEFDKAQEIYEKIVAKNPNEAEAYWGIVLCKYGIEYVEDPNTYKRVPTCHRTQLESVLTDVDYLSAIENADYNQKLIYEQEAEEIDKLQKDILSIVHNEKPFDVFICYKETDENGKRTVDSVLANDIYYQLTQEGLKVFYAAITLENKLGQEYEPYIFSALNSAKVMLVVGTKPENFNAVWVKNEWSRYLKLMSNDRSKTLIPCFRDMDAYDLPDEFSHLQAQDMSKIGFITDIVRGIKKLIAPAKEQSINKVVVESNNTDIAPLLKRAFIFLEDSNWKDADEYCERVLDLDPECAMAYLGKLMAELKVNKQDDLAKLETPFNENDNYKKAIRYADNKLSEKLNQYIKDINYSITKKTYDTAVEQLNIATASQQYLDVSLVFLKLEDFLDSKDLYDQCIQKAEICQKDEKYNIAKGLMSSKSYKTAIDYFNEISGWKDAQEQIDICNQKIKEIEVENLKKEQEKEKLRIAAEKSAKKRKKYVSIFVPIVCVCIAFVIILNAVIIPNNKYNDALELYKSKKYNEAIAVFTELDGYKDSNDKIKECNYLYALDLCDNNKYNEAITVFTKLNGYKYSKDKINECNYLLATDLFNKKDYTKSLKYFNNCYEYKDSSQKAVKAKLEIIKSAKVGDIVYFGTYEQDNNISNGMEDVEWLVLAKEDNRIFVISDKALDCKKYNDMFDGVAWKTCTLRKWLNNDFINSAFTNDEKKRIPTVNVSADKNPEYSTDPDKATKDKVFLLSINETNKYFSSNNEMKCVPTKYAIANGAYVNSGNGNCWWWLRTPGNDSYFAACIRSDGHLHVLGYSVDSKDRAVRPAMWINIK